MKKTAIILCLLALASIIQVCTVQEKETSSLKGNFEAFDVLPEEQNIDVAESQTLNFKHGTSIVIPEHAFVDEFGKAITGQVDVKLREFHSATDIISSGIPMSYDSAGVTYDFESAGMFELKASQDGKPVFIASGKSIEVNMASYQDGAYNFYYLNENPSPYSLNSAFISMAQAQNSREPGRRWELMQSSLEPQKNTSKKQKLDSLNRLLPTAPVEPKPLQEDDLAFDFDIDLVDFPELAAFQGIVWVYSGDNESAFDNPEKNEWIFEETWTDVILDHFDQATMEYKLTLSNSQKSFETLVKPALNGKALDKAHQDFDRKMTEYKKLLEEEKEKFAAIEKEKKFLQQQSNFIRSFRVQKLGVYNWDVIFKRAGAKELQAYFTLDQKEIDDQIAIFLIIDRNVIKLRKNKNLEYSNFAIDMNTSNKLVAVLPDAKVGVMSSDEIAEVNWAAIPQNSRYTFNLSSVNKPISSIEDLNSLLNQL